MFKILKLCGFMSLGYSVFVFTDEGDCMVTKCLFKLTS